MSTLAVPSAAPDRAPALRIPLVGWLALGVLFTALVGNRFNLAALGWVASVPWLIALRHTRGWTAWLGLGLALQLGAFLNILKIVTEPLPWYFAPMFSVPMALGSLVAYAVFEGMRRRLGDAWGLALFPALSIVFETLSARTSEMGSWGSLAYSQLDNPALMQVVALFGLSGVTALLALSSAVVAVLVDRGDHARWLPALGLTAGLVLLAQGYGAVRLDRVLDGPKVTVATVTTDVHMGADGLPSREALAVGTDQLFDRTLAAVARGAEVVVWNEGATAIHPDQEAVFLERAEALTRAQGVDVLYAYMVPAEEPGAAFENKYVWMTPEGPLETYFKHHPVPGEGSVRGTGPLVVHDRPYGRAAGAICYDYDFPAMGLEHAAGGAGLVLVPSSDWRGIDPYHTQMAAVRGIESGFSVIRSVRWATSTATDPTGRVRGSASWFEGDRVMVAEVPAVRVPTLYSQVGEVLTWLSGLVLLGGLGVLAQANGVVSGERGRFSHFHFGPVRPRLNLRNRGVVSPISTLASKEGFPPWGGSASSLGSSIATAVTIRTAEAPR